MKLVWQFFYIEIVVVIFKKIVFKNFYKSAALSRICKEGGGSNSGGGVCERIEGKGHNI